MENPIHGLHHVTATVNDAQDDLDFCLGALGLRLVKKTVNFDNHNVFHFYYGNERGTPGTIWTTFPYKGWNVPVGTKGAGQVTVTSFSVPPGSLGYWDRRLRERGLEPRENTGRFGEESLKVTDSSGLEFELIAAARDDREPWTAGGLSGATAIRGLHSVTLSVNSPARTVELLTGLLGFRQVAEMEGLIRLAVNGDEAGKYLDVAYDADASPARNGLGTVHHVALAVTDGEEQLKLREELIRMGLRATEVRDRCYFNSIYFREPGGVLLEIATVQPGFAIDEEPAHLGESLKLPPWEEPNRLAIEKVLPPIVVPSA